MKVSTMENDDHNLLNIKKLQNLIETGLPSISKQMNEAVLLIGATGSGKSTLINSLIGSKLLGKYDAVLKSVKIVLAPGEEGPVIGEGASETNVPQLWIDKKTNIGYFDCPGFGDNRGAEQDIANAVFIKQLFSITKTVKVIVAAAHAQFNLENERGGGILKFIQQLSELFPNVELLKDCTTLVVTKAKDFYDVEEETMVSITVEDIQNTLLRIKEDHTKNPDSQYFKESNSKFVRVFNLFLEKNKIAILKTPAKSKDDSHYITFPQKVLDTIQELEYVQLKNVSVPISNESFKKISKFYEGISKYSETQMEKVKSFLESSLKSKNIQHTINLLNILKDINLIREDEEFNSERAGDCFNSGMTVNSINHYIVKIKELCNAIGFQNNTTLEEEFCFLEEEKRKKTIEDLSNSEKNAILNRNPFEFILKAIAFISSIEKPPADLSNYSHNGIHEIIDIIIDKLKSLQNSLIKEFSDIFASITMAVDEYLVSLGEKDIEKLHQLRDELSNDSKKTNPGEYLKSYSDTLVKYMKSDKLVDSSDKIQEFTKRLDSVYENFDIQDEMTRPDYIFKMYLSSCSYKIQQKSEMLTFEYSMSQNEKYIKMQDKQINTLKNKEKIEQHLKQFEYQYKASDKRGNASSYDECNKIKGVTISLHKVLEAIDEQKTKTITSSNFNNKLLAVYATKEINIDTDIMYKGGQIILVAPTISCYGSYKIDLSGNNGRDGNHGNMGYWHGGKSGDNYNTSGGSNGESGTNATPGEPGGSLIMIAQGYLGTNLSIFAQGGSGGNGGNGGNGGGCNEIYFSAPYARSGGNGGNGGNGGKGGEAGIVKIFYSKNESNIYPQLTNHKGEDGKYGKGGSGGNPWTGKLYSSGDDGRDGANGTLINSKQNDKISSKDFNEISNDYLKFLSTMNDVTGLIDYNDGFFHAPEDYAPIIGVGTEFSQFLSEHYY